MAAFSWPLILCKSIFFEVPLSINTLLPIRKLAKMDSLWDDVETEIRSICLDRINKNVSGLEPEPGFIIGLRALTTTLARKWAEEY
jgi:hypothetical protein